MLRKPGIPGIFLSVISQNALIYFLIKQSYTYIPSTLNVDLILWHTQLIVCAKNIKSWVIHFTFQAYTMPWLCPINWIVCVSLFEFHNWISKIVLALAKTARSAQTHKSISFIWIVWSTLYVYLCDQVKKVTNLQSVFSLLFYMDKTGNLSYL